jgi:ribonucleoside-diphosphate reductase alpha chain
LALPYFAHSISALSRLAGKVFVMAPTAFAQTSFDDPAPSFARFSKSPAMQVRKRNGSLEPADVNKIVRAVERCCGGLEHVDPMRIASRTIGGLFHGASTKELELLSIQTAASLIAEEPEYSTLAARLLLGVIDKEVANQDVYSFSQSVALGKQQGLISEDLAKFVAKTPAS